MNKKVHVEEDIIIIRAEDIIEIEVEVQIIILIAALINKMVIVINKNNQNINMKITVQALIIETRIFMSRKLPYQKRLIKKSIKSMQIKKKINFLKEIIEDKKR